MIAELAAELDALSAKNLRRSLFQVESRRNGTFRSASRNLVDFASNDYLGLSSDRTVASAARAALTRWGTGSGASRLLSGNLAVHTELEEKLARFKGEEAATVFSSGYLANLGAITALLDERDVVLVDRLNHASLIDAARLSRAKLWVYGHCDAAALSKLLDRAKAFRRRMVVTDSYFSMDGHTAPLKELAGLCAAKKAILMVDEAHALGVYGKHGSGLVEAAGLAGRIDVVVGTLSKALGSVGGFVVGKTVLKDYLSNRARPFIYTTAPSPAASAAASKAVDLVRSKPILRRRLWENTRLVREGLLALGYDLMDSEGPIIPVLAGSPARAVEWRDFLYREGFFVPAIRPPSVPNRTDRLRLSMTAAHTKDQIARLLKAFKKMRK